MKTTIATAALIAAILSAACCKDSKQGEMRKASEERRSQIEELQREMQSR